MKKLLLIILILNLSSYAFSQCDFYREYYYSIPNEMETKIYKFQDFFSDYHYYWVVTINPKNKTITTDFYDSNFIHKNIFIEKLDEEGSKLTQYTLFDENNKVVNLKIIEDDVFKWCDENEFLYSVIDSINPEIDYISKKREILETDNLIIKGKFYKVLKTKDTFSYNYKDEEVQKTISITYYAKDRGVIENRTYYADGNIRKMQLTEILSELDFDKLKKASR